MKSARNPPSEKDIEPPLAVSESFHCGAALIFTFIILAYGLFGVFADIALTLNVVLLLAVLTLFGATLTLPGIAGIQPSARAEFRVG